MSLPLRLLLDQSLSNVRWASTWDTRFGNRSRLGYRCIDERIKFSNSSAIDGFLKNAQGVVEPTQFNYESLRKILEDPGTKGWPLYPSTIVDGRTTGDLHTATRDWASNPYQETPEKGKHTICGVMGPLVFDNHMDKSRTNCRHHILKPYNHNKDHLIYVTQAEIDPENDDLENDSPHLVICDKDGMAEEHEPGASDLEPDRNNIDTKLEQSGSQTSLDAVVYNVHDNESRSGTENAFSENETDDYATGPENRGADCIPSNIDRKIIYTFELHLPYFVLLKDKNTISFICERQQHCRALCRPKDGEEPGIIAHKCRVSLLVTGFDEWLYTVICCVDSHDWEDASLNMYTDEGLDAPTGGAMLRDTPIWNARKYFLTALSERVLQVTREWANLSDTVERELEPYNSMFERPEAFEEGFHDDKDLTKTKGYIWLANNLRTFRDSLTTLIDTLENFQKSQLGMFATFDENLRASFHELIEKTDKPLMELRHHRDSMQQKAETLDSLKDSIINASALQESMVATSQGKHLQYLTWINLLFLPMGLVTSIYVMAAAVIVTVGVIASMNNDWKSLRGQLLKWTRSSSTFERVILLKERVQSVRKMRLAALDYKFSAFIAPIRQRLLRRQAPPELEKESQNPDETTVVDEEIVNRKETTLKNEVV
ncbi:MAG: hypothetical protein M1828_005368 [Chrysothrix sp. TS-e1954]|nr:MAG: hypothetical protein M1828_005368 [Chrysothrix sp. TS-e1954]